MIGAVVIAHSRYRPHTVYPVPVHHEFHLGLVDCPGAGMAVVVFPVDRKQIQWALPGWSIQVEKPHSAQRLCQQCCPLLVQILVEVGPMSWGQVGIQMATLGRDGGPGPGRMMRTASRIGPRGWLPAQRARSPRQGLP